MILMGVLGFLLIVGVTLTLWWNGCRYRTWEPIHSPKGAAFRYLRGVAIALVAGFWAGALVTGPAVRLIMRLLAVAAGDDAQGMITEAEEVVGEISAEGTIGLYVFGGIFPGFISGALYVVLRRWLPSGRLAGVAFGALHLVIAATRVDPLRPENPDFDIVGPGWLSVATFSVAAIVHGAAVVAIANRYSHTLPLGAGARTRRILAVLPLILPALMLIPAAAFLVVLVVGLGVTVVGSQLTPLVRALRSRRAVIFGRAVLVGVAIVLLPGTVIALHDIAVPRL